MAFAGMPSGLAWLVAGIVLLILEILVPGVFLMWLGLAALVTGGLVLLAEPSLGIQVVVFALAAAVSIAIGLRVRRPKRAASLNTPRSGLIGRQARILVTTPALRARVGDSDWPARVKPGTAPPQPDDVLDVIDVDGTTVILAPAAKRG